MILPTPSSAELVLVECYATPSTLKQQLNKMANDPTNRYNLEFLTEDGGRYTAIFYLQPEP
jgi:hypothetical protein